MNLPIATMLSPIGTDNVVKDLGRSDMAGYALGTVLVVAQAIEIYESFSVRHSAYIWKFRSLMIFKVVRSLCLLIAIFIQNVMSGLVNLGRGFFHTINDFVSFVFWSLLSSPIADTLSETGNSTSHGDVPSL